MGRHTGTGASMTEAKVNELTPWLTDLCASNGIIAENRTLTVRAVRLLKNGRTIGQVHNDTHLSSRWLTIVSRTVDAHA